MGDLEIKATGLTLLKTKKRFFNQPSQFIMKRSIEYISRGIYGYVRYTDNESDFKLYYELLGGESLAYISIPKIADWHKETNKDLDQREEILNFIAAQIIEDQASSCEYRITDDSIEIFKPYAYKIPIEATKRNFNTMVNSSFKKFFTAPK